MGDNQLILKMLMLLQPEFQKRRNKHKVILTVSIFKMVHLDESRHFHSLTHRMRHRDDNISWQVTVNMPDGAMYVYELEDEIEDTNVQTSPNVFAQKLVGCHCWRWTTRIWRR